MSPLLSFGEFTLDAAAGTLQRGRARIPLEPQPARLLVHLVEHAGELLTRDQLAAHLWGRHTHVDFAEGLNYCVRQVRIALGDDSRRPVYIETLPRRGYRFLMPVRSAAYRPRAGAFRRRGRWAALAVTACLGTLFILETRPNRHHDVAVQLVQTVHEAIWAD